MAQIPVRHVPEDHPHHAYEYGPADYGRVSAALKRVSWGAIFAGAVVAAVTHFLLYLLGIGIGLETFDPATEGDSARGFGIGQGVWLVVSGLLALFAGGWVAGRLAGMPRRVDGALHGLVTWGLATILGVYFLASGIGTVLSGVRSAIGEGASLVGQGVAAAAPAAADALGDGAQQLDLSGIEAQAEALLRDVGTSPGDAGDDIDEAIDEAFAGSGPVDQQAREELVQTLAAETDLSEAEARQTVNDWEAQAQDLRQRAEGAVQTVREGAPGVAEDAAEVLGTAALWSFFALLLGAGAALLGGLLGSPHDLPATAVRRESGA
jgi:hypothetical protein